MGLVPKAGGKTRLIFHLSYDFGPSEHQKSINYHTPEDICKVRYNDLDAAVRNCMHIMQQTGTKVLFFGKTDCSHAFRIMPIKISHRKFLTMKARHPKTKKWWYFVDKCLPFGSSISCAQFQAFSDALKHVAEWSIQNHIANGHTTIVNKLPGRLFDNCGIRNFMQSNYAAVFGSL